MRTDSVRSASPGHCDSIHGLIVAQARQNPEAAAILAPGRRPLSYLELSHHVAEVVESLNAMGIARNDRVAVVLPEGPEMAVALLAISAAATCAPLNPCYRSSEFEFYFADLSPRALLIASGRESPAVQVARSRDIPVLELTARPAAEAGLFAFGGEIRRDPAPGGCAGPEDAALALHTSGTSARPKLVALTHRNICASAYNIRDAVQLTEADRCLNVMPLFHIHGLSTVYASLAAGGSVVCMDGFSADRFFEWLESFRPTWYTAAPSLHQAILEYADRFPGIAERSSLRFIRSASAPMPRQWIPGLEGAFGVPFVEAYGMTEAAPQIASNRLPPHERKAGSVGPAAGPDVAIMDEAGHRLPPGEPGEVVIRGVNVIRAYENDPEATGRALAGDWFRTGDRGYLDAEGYLFITGRLKEIINRGGEKISPRKVDEVLLDHPAVAQAVTFAVPHPVLGENVAAAVVLRPECSREDEEQLIQELRDFAATRLASFQVPQPIVIVDEIPKGPTGKLRRSDLPEKLGLTASCSREAVPLRETVEPRTPIEQSLTDLWASVLGTDPPGVHDNFFQLGGDSMSATRVLSRLRDAFQVELPMDSLFERPTVAGLAELVAESMADLLAGQKPSPSPLERHARPRS